MLHFWNFFLRKSSFAFLLVVGLVIFGIFSVVAIPKESAPEVRIPVAIVSIPFPGASALDVEELVTDKVETGLSNNLENVKKITSSSREGVSAVVVEFDANADLDKSIDDVKGEIDKVKLDLPSDANDPIVSEVNFVDQPIMVISIASKLYETEFIDLTDTVIDELETIQGISRVDKSGIASREVQVVVEKEKLQKFGVHLMDVVNAISHSNTSLPVGSIELDGVEYTVRFDGNIKDPAEVRDIAILNSSGEPVYIRDIAFVSDGIGDATTFSRVSVGGNPSQQAVTLSLFKKSGGDVTQIAQEVREKVNALEKTILADEDVLIVIDTGEFVKTDLVNLSLTGLQTIGLVMIILLVTIGWREAFIAGLAIPLSFLIGFIGLNASGNTINFVSLFSLILAVGILVDSSIVMTEGIHTRMKRGINHKEAAYQTIKDFYWPLISGTMTTVAVFAPLFFISGVTGKFIASIPFTIIFVLLASLFVSLAIIPLYASLFLRAKSKGNFENKQEQYTKKLQAWYRVQLYNILGNRKKENIFMAAIAILLIGAISLPITGVVKTIFFPGEDSDYIYIDIEKPIGSTLEQTDLSVRAVEEILLNNSYVESFATTVGSGSAFSEGTIGTHFGNITVLLKKDRDKTSTEILGELRQHMAYIGSAKVSVLEPSSGPPIGAPVLVKFFSENSDDLKEAVVIGYNVLKTVNNAVEVDTSIKDFGIDFIIHIDRAKAAELGVDPSVVAETLRTAVHGTTATTITEGGENIDVVVKTNLNTDYLDSHDTSRTTIDTLRYVEIPASEGSIFLGSIVSISLESSSKIINHEDKSRVETISSQVKEGSIVSEVVEEFHDKMENQNLPDGVRFTIGGETEEVDQSFQDLFLALIVGIVLVIAILVLQFNSYRLALYIVIIVPISLVGILTGLAISGKTLSFPSIMGYIALSGIVVNNSIILIDVINKLRREHSNEDLKHIIVEGAALRLRPILLTTITTVIGIIPLTYASALWSPLAYAIIFGLSFSVVVTLILVPIFYHRWPSRKY